MDRSVVLTFCEQLSQARENAFRDAESLGRDHSRCGRLGSLLNKKLGDLGKYKKDLGEKARHSALAEDVPAEWPRYPRPFLLAL